MPMLADAHISSLGHLWLTFNFFHWRSFSGPKFSYFLEKMRKRFRDFRRKHAFTSKEVKETVRNTVVPLK